MEDIMGPPGGGTWQGRAEQMVAEINANTQRMTALLDELTLALHDAVDSIPGIASLQDGDNRNYE